ncbi:MAG: alpha/beta hydrolase-fold protein [Erysipelotrichaceae bacterium]|nr:alpha/beta hydrolase-fold protein [Erysipelotrichaceae bacterium]
MIIKEEVTITPFDCQRMLHIYLPDDYETSEKRYPVFYMYDGHNLFSDEDATYGKSWGIKDYFDQHHLDIIVVGMECNHEGNYRLWEYSPYDFVDPYYGEVKGLGKIYMQWVVDELKPYIDQKYRTLADREHTAIGGSSMGGLMSLYTIKRHSDVFSKAACVSPYQYHVHHDLMKEPTLTDSNSRIYISWGAYENRPKSIFARVTRQNLLIANQFSENRAMVYLNEVLKGNHSEAAWEKEVPTFVKFLFEKW